MTSSQLDMMDSLLSSGKTSPESSATNQTPSDVSWARLSELNSPSLSLEAGRVQVWLADHGQGPRGSFATLNISEWPNDAVVCSLSSTLETGSIPRKYYLSAKACRGILRRAEKRGKTLPVLLVEALKAGASERPT